MPDFTGRPRERIAYLDGHRIRRALLDGFRRVTGERTHLDRINVFPVPDGDTGTNLALTLSAIEDELRPVTERHAGRLLEHLADAALDGARGNSGAIFAQFCQGLAAGAREHARLDAEALAGALASANEQAREAMEVPREGTMLSVIAAFTQTFAATQQGGVTDLEVLLDRGLVAAREALRATTQQLEVLRRAGVEDAGARGFVLLLEGIADLLRDGSVADHAGESVDPPLVSHVSPEELSRVDEYRFCTECIVSGERLDRAELKRVLNRLGTSVMVIGGNRRLRVHAHVRRPAELFAAMENFGRISGQKADDMMRQELALRDRLRRVAVVTDSAADLPQSVWDELAIHMVPLRVNFGAQSYLDKSGLDSAAFMAELARRPEPPSTSQPPAGDFRRVFEFLASHYEHVVSVNLTSRVSGTCQAAQAAARRAANAEQITVVDSLNVSLGQGLIAMRAAEAAAGGAAVDEVLAATRDSIRRTHCLGLVRDLRFAVRGGRLRPMHQRLGDWLGVRPILGTRPDGRVGLAGFVGPRRDGIVELVRAARRRLRNGETCRLAVGHAGWPEGAMLLREECRRQLPEASVLFVTDIGPALGVHGGPGTLALAIQR